MDPAHPAAEPGDTKRGGIKRLQVVADRPQTGHHLPSGQARPLRKQHTNPIHASQSPSCCPEGRDPPSVLDLPAPPGGCGAPSRSSAYSLRAASGGAVGWLGGAFRAAVLARGLHAGRGRRRGVWARDGQRRVMHGRIGRRGASRSSASPARFFSTPRLPVDARRVRRGWQVPAEPCRPQGSRPRRVSRPAQSARESPSADRQRKGQRAAPLSSIPAKRAEISPKPLPGGRPISRSYAGKTSSVESTEPSPCKRRATGSSPVSGFEDSPQTGGLARMCGLTNSVLRLGGIAERSGTPA